MCDPCARDEVVAGVSTEIAPRTPPDDGERDHGRRSQPDGNDVAFEAGGVGTRPGASNGQNAAHAANRSCAGSRESRPSTARSTTPRTA